MSQTITVYDDGTISTGDSVGLVWKVVRVLLSIIFSVVISISFIFFWINYLPLKLASKNNKSAKQNKNSLLITDIVLCLLSTGLLIFGIILMIGTAIDVRDNTTKIVIDVFFAAPAILGFIYEFLYILLRQILFPKILSKQIHDRHIFSLFNYVQWTHYQSAIDKKMPM